MTVILVLYGYICIIILAYDLLYFNNLLNLNLILVHKIFNFLSIHLFIFLFINHYYFIKNLMDNLIYPI